MNTTTETSDKPINRMFAAGAHYGVAKARRHPSTKAGVFASKNKNDIVDLEYTEKQLDAAKEVAKALGQERKLLMFVGGKPESHKIVRDAAEALDAPYCVGRWIGGTLTNNTEIKKRVHLLKKLVSDRDSGALGKYTKFERLQIDRQIEKLQTMYEGLLPLEDKLPHALFVIDPRREAIAVEEAHRKHIPVIALANTDCDVSTIAYPILGNDSAVKSIKYFVDEIAEAYKEGLALPPAAPATPAKTA